MTFAQQSLVDLDQGVPRYTEDDFGFSCGREFGTGRQPAVENGRFELLVKGLGRLARVLGRPIELDFEQRIPCACS